MTLSSGIDAARWSVLLDVRHPMAYLALPPTAALARELGVEVNWLPLEVPALHPPSDPRPDDDRGTRHRRYRAQALAREIETYAPVHGLVLREYYRSPDPAAVNLAWLWLREREPERLEPFLTEAFRAYWALELDPSSERAVATLLDTLGADASGFLAWCKGDGPAAAAALAEELRQRGLFGVPCHLVEGEVFLGRQHLPMIRWMLEARADPGPRRANRPGPQGPPGGSRGW